MSVKLWLSKNKTTIAIIALVLFVTIQTYTLFNPSNYLITYAPSLIFAAILTLLTFLEPFENVSIQNITILSAHPADGYPEENHRYIKLSFEAVNNGNKDTTLRDVLCFVKNIRLERDANELLKILDNSQKQLPTLPKGLTVPLTIYFDISFTAQIGDKVELTFKTSGDALYYNDKIQGVV